MSLKGVDQKFLKNLRYSKKHNKRGQNRKPAVAVAPKAAAPAPAKK
jgi:hypothetical protein